MKVLISLLVVLFLLSSEFFGSQAFLFKKKKTCSIKECNKGTCVQLQDKALRSCTGRQCTNGSGSDQYLYRVLREDEDPKKGLVAKDPKAKKSIQSHVGCGSRKNYKSQYISTTANKDAAEAWARGLNKTVVQIDIGRLPRATKVIDLSKASRAVLPGVMARNFASKYAEVLIEGRVPPRAISDVFYTEPHNPKKRKRNCGC